MVYPGTFEFLLFDQIRILHPPPFPFHLSRASGCQAISFIIMLFFLPYAIDNFSDEVNKKIVLKN